MEAIPYSSSAETRIEARGVRFGADVLVDVVDAADHVTGTARRDDVLKLGFNFRVAHVLVFNKVGELLLQHIAPGQRHQGAWGASAAGFVQAHESYQAAPRESLPPSSERPSLSKQ